jgi:uncharacterized protein (UPF0179 family)
VTLHAVPIVLTFLFGAAAGALLNGLHRCALIEKLKRDFVSELREESQQCFLHHHLLNQIAVINAHCAILLDSPNLRSNARMRRITNACREMTDLIHRTGCPSSVSSNSEAGRAIAYVRSPKPCPPCRPS